MGLKQLPAGQTDELNRTDNSIEHNPYYGSTNLRAQIAQTPNDQSDKFKNSIYISFENKEIFENALGREPASGAKQGKVLLVPTCDNMPRQMQPSRLSTEKLKINNLINTQLQKIQAQTVQLQQLPPDCQHPACTQQQSFPSSTSQSKLYKLPFGFQPKQCRDKQKLNQTDTNGKAACNATSDQTIKKRDQSEQNVSMQQQDTIRNFTLEKAEPSIKMLGNTSQVFKNLYIPVNSNSSNHNETKQIKYELNRGQASTTPLPLKAES